MQTRRWMLSAAAAAATGLALPAAAQEFPSKTIKFLVPFAAGSATDALARSSARACRSASASRW